MSRPPPTRRDFLRAVAGGAAAASLNPFSFALERNGRKPDVLFIAIDDLNDWVGCLGGHPGVKTPNLDRLAQRGVLFTNAFCAAPACNPSRAALMTGIRPSTSGVYHNDQPFRKSEALADAVTLPQHFMAHGYRAIASGKIFHGPFPDPASWDDYWPSQQKCKPGDPKPDGVPLNGLPKAGHFDWGPAGVPVEKMGDWQVADWVINQLGQDPGRPRFLGCGFFRPHLPWYVPQEFFDLYPLEEVKLPDVNEHDLEDVPPPGINMARPKRDHAKVIKYNQWRQAVQAYLASISFTDACLGRVLDAFDQSPRRDNTIIVLWSDHGWHLGEKLHWRKFALWEEATHNVLMISAPGVTRPGGRCDRPVNLIDIYPTLAELCGLAPRKELEGSSLVPLLRDPGREWERPSLTIHGKDNHTIRTGRWRYIRYADGSEELYDRSVDDLEWTNLADNPEYGYIKEELRKWLPKVNAENSPKQENKKKNTEEDEEGTGG